MANKILPGWADWVASPSGDSFCMQNKDQI